MPLFSFYQYVKNRHDDSKADFYGIALDKEKMFKLGARNAIYGTTNLPENNSEPDSEERRITSYLPDKEQYRYILTNIDDKNDWTHEREWRWTNQFGLSHDKKPLDLRGFCFCVSDLFREGIYAIKRDTVLNTVNQF